LETKNTQEAAAAQGEHEIIKQEQVQDYLEKVDKESQTRGFSGFMKHFFYGLCIAVTLYHLYVSVMGTPPVHIHRSLHVGMMLVLAFIMYPMRKKASRKKVAIYDWALCALALFVPIFIWSDFINFIMRAGIPSPMDTFVTTVLVVLTLEAARRITGWALPILSGIFIAYGLFGRNFPGMFMHRGYTWPQLGNTILGTEGILGTSVAVSASFIFLFVLFGAVMQKSGMGQFFTEMAMAIAGAAKGGPAKVSVIGSALMGSINGSAIANVCTTGPFTIPLMKKSGYSKEFAGAVEASASVGGQILPPVMGAAAFIMAEILGVNYSQIIIWAIIPALLFFAGIYIQVHLRASRSGLVGIPRDQLPKIRNVMRERGHMALPLLFLFYMLFFSGTTLIFSAFWTIMVTIVVSWLRPATRMSFKDILDAFADGAKQTAPVAIACACVGIIIGIFAITGFGLNMADAIITLGNMNMLLTLVFTMLACMIMGMGLPSIPAYIITATIAAPALARLGVPPGAAHMFAFYFAMFANITPPVALVSFAAAGLSGGNPMRTSVQALKLAIAGFIIPYIFVFSPALMLIDTTFLGGLQSTASAFIGVLLLGSAVEGFLFTKINTPLRLLMLGGALGLIIPGLSSDLIGLGITVFVFLLQRAQSKKVVPAVDFTASPGGGV